MLTVDTDVLVVGAGLTGLTASLFLARQGIAAMTVARHAGTANSPRAHVLSQRTMEIFRDLSVEERVRQISTPLTQLGHNVMLTGFQGLEIGRYSCYGAGTHQLSDFAAASPCVMTSAAQHLVEPVLLAAARERGLEVRWSTEFVSLEQSPQHVLVRVRERRTGAEYCIRARYVVAADGARSAMARELGIEFHGEPGLMSMMNAWVEVDLSRYTAHRPACIYSVMQPGNDYWVGSGLWICHEPFHDWMITRQYDPAEGEPDTSEAAIVAHARAVIGDPDAPVRVKDVSKWQVNDMVAAQYRSGRVFLAGDAAHRHPPSSGLGANMSIQDAYNLAWKLTFVLQGHADEKLLDSYNEERQPVGRQSVQHAIRTLHNMSEIPKALGFFRGQSSEEGWASLRDLFTDSPGADARRAKLAEAIKLQNYRSNALGIQLGQRYASSAIASDETPAPTPTRDPILHYEQSTHPGSHLPHAWVEREGRKVSTLDLAGRGRFCLITGIGGEPWVAAAASVGKKLGIELPVFFVGARCQYDDVLGEWAALREIADRGALLVRPDCHVAWRSHDRASDPETALHDALRKVLQLAR